MYEISTENSLTGVLLAHPKGVTICMLKKLTTKLQSNLRDCTVDVTSKAVYGLLDASEKFVWQENRIVFVPPYGSDIQKLNSTLAYILPTDVYRVLIEVPLE